MGTSLSGARARHKECVDCLHSIAKHVQDLESHVKDLQAENKQLRATNVELRTLVDEVQAKHNAAQSQLDASITMSITPRTRRNLDAQKRKLQPALGVSLASAFVEARYQKHQKEIATREFVQEHATT